VLTEIEEYLASGAAQPWGATLNVGDGDEP